MGDAGSALTTLTKRVNHISDLVAAIGRDLERLNSLCDELHDIARQMLDLERVSSNETNQKNLRLVLETLDVYNREYEHIQKAQEN